jgi:hypothetical protein
MDKKVEAREYLCGSAPLQPGKAVRQAGGINPPFEGGHIVRVFAEKVASGNDPGNWPSLGIAEIAEKNRGFDKEIMPFPRYEMCDHANGAAVGMIDLTV